MYWKLDLEIDQGRICTCPALFSWTWVCETTEFMGEWGYGGFLSIWEKHGGDPHQTNLQGSRDASLLSHIHSSWTLCILLECVSESRPAW